MREFLKKCVVRSSIYANPLDRWIWIRVHRTGTTSLLKALTGSHEVNSGLDLINDSVNKTQFEEWLEDENFNNYRVWSFVRDPYTRFRSMAGLFGHRPEQFASCFYALQKASPVVWRHTQPQHLFLDPSSYVSFLGRFENLDEDYLRLRKFLNLPPIEETLPKLNSSAGTGGILTPRVIEFVKEEFKKDFEIFNYDQHHHPSLHRQS